MSNKRQANWIFETAEISKKILLSLLEKKVRCASDVICFVLSRLFWVATFRRAGFALSQADFYFKARGDRLYSAVRRRVYYLNSRIPETSRSKTGFRGNRGSERASLCMQLRCMSTCDFFIQKKKRKTITRQEIKICIQCCDSKSTNCQRLTGKKRIFRESDSISNAIRNGNSSVLAIVSEVYRGPSGFRKTT